MVTAGEETVWCDQNETKTAFGSSRENVLATFDAGDAVVARHGLATRRLDLVDHGVGHAVPRARSVSCTAEIVHDDGRAFTGQGPGMFAANSNPALQVMYSH